MTTTSALQTQLNASAGANTNPWSTIEAAVEVIKIALENIEVPAPEGGATEAKQDAEITEVKKGMQFRIAPFDSITLTYVGSTNNIATQVFKNGTTTVATLAYTYVGGGAANDDLVASITQS